MQKRLRQASILCSAGGARQATILLGGHLLHRQIEPCRVSCGINAMFRPYRDSSRRYVYLSDVPYKSTPAVNKLSGRGSLRFVEVDGSHVVGPFRSYLLQARSSSSQAETSTARSLGVLRQMLLKAIDRRYNGHTALHSRAIHGGARAGRQRSQRTSCTRYSESSILKYHSPTAKNPRKHTLSYGRRSTGRRSACKICASLTHAMTRSTLRKPRVAC